MSEGGAASREQRLRYRFDDFMSKGSGSIFVALTVVFFSLLVLLSLIRLALVNTFGGLEVERGRGGWRQVYLTFLELTDPGSMTQDVASSGWIKIVTVAAGLAGVVMFSALIAFITTALDGRLAQLRKGHSKVIVEDHTLILGWNDRVVDILNELILANESEEDPTVVILAEKDKEEMDDFLALNVKDSMNTKIVTRSGAPSTRVNLDIASVETCRSVIALSQSGIGASQRDMDESDLRVIKTLLGVTSALPDDGDVAIVAEVFSPSRRDAALTIDQDRIVVVDADEILAKILVQTSRSEGLSVVYEEILSFDGSEMYFYETDWTPGLTFAETAYRFTDGIPMGICRGEEVFLNPGNDTVLSKGDELLILATDDSTIDFASTPVVPKPSRQSTGVVVEPHVERELFVGVTNKLETIVREYADYVVDGSQIDIMLRASDPETIAKVRALDEAVPSLHLRVLEADPFSVEDLLELRPFEYDNIILLSQAGEMGAQEMIDSETLLLLLHFQHVFRSADIEVKTKLIAEVLDTGNRELVTETGVREFIVSNNLISMLVAQVSENRQIKTVYDNLFAEDGSEIYLKPVELYVDELPAQVTYADLIAAAAHRDEVSLGYKVSALENEPDENYGVKLIPPKDEIFTITAGDTVVVLAEDES